MLKNFERLKTGLNVMHLLSKLEANSNLWDEIKLRQITVGSPHKDTKTIFIRWSKGLDVHSAFNDLEAIDYPARDILVEVNDLILAVMTEAMATNLGRVLITKLEPKGKITPHADEGIVCAAYERFHIPLSSEAGNWFYAGNPDGDYEAVFMRQGDLWFFNNKEVHWLENESTQPRLHLIVDAMAPHLRRGMH